MRKRIDFLCFYTEKAWWDGCLPPGTAGAEEAVVEVARALARRSWTVRVYNNCARQKSISENLAYIPSYEFTRRDPSDILVLWRDPALCDHPSDALKRYLWLHDSVDPTALSPERLTGIEKVIALSKYQRALWPHLPEEKIFASGNGISPGLDIAGVRKSRHCVFDSAPERGLDCLLDLWPRIHDEVPDATLDIFYGWEIWNFFYEKAPSRKKWRDAVLEKLDRLSGVTTKCVRLPQEELWRIESLSGVWLYPTECPEVSCMNAMKAQATGMIPVTTTVGALRENVRWGSRIDTKRIYSDTAAQDQFVRAAVRSLRDPDESDRNSMMDWARGFFSWDGIARAWEAEFQMPPAVSRT